MTVEQERTVILTDHARQRMASMRVDESEVIDAVRFPDMLLPDQRNPNARVASKGRLRVPYEPRGSGDVVITVYWKDTERREDGPTTPIPNKVGNRAFIDQLLLWGATTGRRRGDFQQMRLPDGTLFDVRPPHLHAGNSSKRITAAYRLLDVSAEQFWSRTERIKLPRERVHTTSPTPSPTAAPVETPTNGQAAPPATTWSDIPEPERETHPGRVLAYFRGHPGKVMGATDGLVERLGLDRRAVAGALGELARAGHLQRVKRGKYKYLRWGETDEQKQQAQEDLAWVTDPANRPTAVRRQTTTMPTMSDESKQILRYYAERPGQAISIAEVAASVGITHQITTSRIMNHLYVGRLERVSPGRYRYVSDRYAAEHPTVPATPDDPLERLDAIQARIDADTPAVVDEPEPEPAPEPADAPAPAPVVYESYEDEVDALLALAVPAGVRARHLALAAQWCDLTRQLLEATRGAQP